MRVNKRAFYTIGVCILRAALYVLFGLLAHIREVVIIGAIHIVIAATVFILELCEMSEVVLDPIFRWVENPRNLVRTAVIVIALLLICGWIAIMQILQLGWVTFFLPVIAIFAMAWYRRRILSS